MLVACQPRQSGPLPDAVEDFVQTVRGKRPTAGRPAQGSWDKLAEYRSAPPTTVPGLADYLAKENPDTRGSAYWMMNSVEALLRDWTPGSGRVRVVGRPGPRGGGRSDCA